jgi:hypothetical protein
MRTPLLNQSKEFSLKHVVAIGIAVNALVTLLLGLSSFRSGHIDATASLPLTGSKSVILFQEPLGIPYAISVAKEAQGR